MGSTAQRHTVSQHFIHSVLQQLSNRNGGTQEEHSNCWERLPISLGFSMKIVKDFENEALSHADDRTIKMSEQKEKFLQPMDQSW